MTSRTMATLAWFLFLSCSSASLAPEPTEEPPRPTTVAEAVDQLKSHWLVNDLDWVLRNPRETVVSTLHLPFGTGVRNAWGLWGSNRGLLASCETEYAEECSGIIFRALWDSVRGDADPNLVRALDCQFAQIEALRIDPYGYDQLRLGATLENIQQQIDEQSLIATQCAQPLRLAYKGDPDLRCWTRAEFSKKRSDPMTLSMLLNWISFRNGFTLKHDPPEVQLVFDERCAWPERPTGF